MRKKYIKLLLVILVAIFVGNINVYAFEPDENGLYCDYGNGIYLSFSETAYNFGTIEFDNGDFDNPNMIGTILENMRDPNKLSIKDNIDWFKEIGIIKNGELTCPPIDSTGIFKDAYVYYGLQETRYALYRECGNGNNCKDEAFSDHFKNWTCNYKSSIGNSTMSIKYIEDTEYIHGRYIITYPDGTTNYLANSNGSGKLYSENGHEYIYSNGNLLETDGTCDDIYYVNDGSRKIMTSLGESGATNNITLSGLCDQHETEEIIHFCNNGNCQMKDMNCPKKAIANEVLNKTMANVIKFIKKVVFNTLQIFVPILLIIMGTVDLVKAMLAGNDKVYKDAFTKFVHKFLAAIIVFFITTIVTVVMGVVAKSGANNTNSWKYYWNKS